MSVISRIEKHRTLMNRMADTVGFDIEAEMQSGRLTPEDNADFLSRCLGCRKTEACGDWMAMQGGHADQAPSYCRNRDAFGKPGQ